MKNALYIYILGWYQGLFGPTQTAILPSGKTEAVFWVM